MKNKICKISLFSAILASITAMPIDARVNTNNSNRSYADAYNQVNALRYQQEYLAANATNATTASATANLPVMVADEKLASAILNNTSEITVAHLDNCAMIYPNGVFRWEIPESGIRRNQTSQCVAVVSLVDANNKNTVLATTTVAAGDSFKCNIDNFPESGMNAVALSKTELPADVAPTMEDVEAVMNEEQKQNAGLKIAAGAILAGVAGNMLAPKEAGSKSMFGTGKTQIMDTAIGAAAGAGIMAASSYSGKVAGDTIKSTAVNAASGMVVGNMMAGASGDSDMLVFKKCSIAEDIKATGQYPDFNKDEYDCIVGRIDDVADGIVTDINTKKDNDYVFYIANKIGETRECSGSYKDSTTDVNCIPAPDRFVEIYLAHKSDKTGQKLLTAMGSSEYANDATIFNPDSTDPTKFVKSTVNIVYDNSFFLIKSAKKTSGYSKLAYMVLKNKVTSKFGGYKTSELLDFQGKDFIYTYRNSDGTVGSQITTDKDKIVFTPTSGSASDGGLIDLNNQARTKGTLVGTAAGGALGGFAGYQGAKSEITDRWTAAVREYQDSLSNFACMTGTRYLSKYNDYVEIPDLKNPE